MLGRLTFALGFLLAPAWSGYAGAEAPPPQAPSASGAAPKHEAGNLAARAEIVFRVQGLECPAVGGLG
jgi:hypothetical protein